MTPAAGGAAAARRVRPRHEPGTTHYAVECRLTVGEAEASLALLLRVAELVRRDVVTVPADARDDALAGLDRVGRAIACRMPAWE